MKEHNWIFDIKSEGNCPMKKMGTLKAENYLFFLRTLLKTITWEGLSEL